MKYFIAILAVNLIWVAYEVWRAPQLEEQEDGSWKTIKPTKKLFKK